MSGSAEVGVVIATRNRRERLLASLARLHALPERPAVVVVDNASSDGTAAAAAAAFPDIEVVSLRDNAGPAARTVGARRLDTPFVAFSDDDSWWAPGALARAAGVLTAHPTLGLVAARILVGPERRLDPTSHAMSLSPLSSADGLPGRRVLGFVACGAVLRRDAYLEVGGFEPRFGFGAEEGLLAMDLAARGWELAYVEEIVAHHHPASSPRPGRGDVSRRNRLWSAWLRRPATSAAAYTLRYARQATRDRTGLVGLVKAIGGLWWILPKRRVVPPELERELRALER